MRLIIHRQNTVGTCRGGVIALEFLTRTAVDDDTAVVHVVCSSTPTAFRLAVGGHGQLIARTTVAFVTVGTLGIVGVEHGGIAQQTESHDDTALVVHAKDGEALLFLGRHGLPTVLSVVVVEGEVVAGKGDATEGARRQGIHCTRQGDIEMKAVVVNQPHTV